MDKNLHVRLNKDLESMAEMKAELSGFQNKSDYIRHLIKNDNSDNIKIARIKVTDALEALSKAFPAYLQAKYNILKAQEQAEVEQTSLDQAPVQAPQ